MEDPRALLTDLFATAVGAADPARCVPPHVPSVQGRLIVVGAGKAAAAMARGVEAGTEAAVSGLVVTRYGHGSPTRHIDVLEAAHPLPDAAGVRAAGRLLARVSGLRADDHVLCLLSGGASALLTLPPPAVSLEDKRALTRSLLHSGAPIADLNCVRKHLSLIKGGRLALACRPARLTTLAISDVAGDDPSTIGSGPTVGDPSTTAQALAVLDRYRIDAPPAVRMFLSTAAAETPKPGDARLAHATLHVIATPAQALTAAAARARARGLDVFIAGDRMEGEARELAGAHAALVRRAHDGTLGVRRPCVLLSGGEATVTVAGAGRGGPNQEFLLALALELGASHGLHALACDTDGIDGTDDAAGAYLTPDTLARATLAGLNAKNHLADNDSYGFFHVLGDLVMTGPTQTNVNDFRALFIP